MGKFKKFAGVCILALCLVCLSLGLNFIEPVSQTVALGSAWTYDPEAQTLTYGSVVLENVTASGYGLTIGSNTGFSGALDLSSGVDGYTVVAIADMAFFNDQGASALTSVILPEGLETIGQGAFMMAMNLSEVVFPESLKTIGLAAFQACMPLSSVILPQNLGYLGGAAFANTAITELTIPENTQFDTAADESTGMFTYYEQLETLTIESVPASAKTLGSSDFAESSALATLTITNAPADKFALEDGALDGLTSLTGIYVNYAYLEDYKAASGWSAYADKIFGIPGTELPS